jgi:phage terminase large subunit
MMHYPTANLLVVRKVATTLHDSCFKELKWAIDRLGVGQFWKTTESPLEITYIPTGQKIYFRGMDDPLKITSIAVDTGSLCWAWIEEAYEISDEKSFDTLDESIRGAVAMGLFKQITLTFNPWSEHTWIKKRFFDVVDKETGLSDDGQVLAITTNYMCNEWLDESDLKIFESMKKNNPARYRVAGLGEWGITDGVVYPNVEEREFEVNEIRKRNKVKSAFGLDFGFTDPTSFVACLIDENNKEIYIFDEWYKENVTNETIYEAIWSMGYSEQIIVADSAEPKSIQELRNLGLNKIRPCRKGRDSVLYGIQLIQQYKIIIRPSCTNTLRDVTNYHWDTDRQGRAIDRPNHDFSHAADALRYAVMDKVRGAAFSFE